MGTRPRVSPIKLVTSSHDELVSSLVSLFEAQFAARSWSGRYRLLEEIFEYLEENSKDREAVMPAFASIVEKLVEGVGSRDISCREQAHIYAASKAPSHRRLARKWFSRTHGDGCQPAGHPLRCARPA